MDAKQHSEHVTTIADVLHKGIYSDAVDEADIVAAKDALENLVEQLEAMRAACERIAELTDGPAYPPALGHAIRLAQKVLSNPAKRQT